jgi:hypothetical protein
VGQQSEIWRGIAGFQHGVPHLKAIVAAGRMKIQSPAVRLSVGPAAVESG